MAYLTIDIWKREPDGGGKRYRCFQIIETGKYCIQSVDFFKIGDISDFSRKSDEQFIELFLELAPEKRSKLFDTIEEAIIDFDREFDG